MKNKGKVFIVGTDSQVLRMFYDQGYIIVSRQADADIVCFIGGSDVNPTLYGERNHHRRTHTSPQQDKRDLEAWRATLSKQMKVGICRGGQLLNVLNGGKLYQHVTNHASGHKMFDTLSNMEIKISSSHHQMMLPAEGAEILGYSENTGDEFFGPDGVVCPRPKVEWESLWYEKTRCFCYQPHPEWGGYNDCTENFFDTIELLR